jgi:hypothetical protein
VIDTKIKRHAQLISCVVLYIFDSNETNLNCSYGIDCYYIINSVKIVIIAPVLSIFDVYIYFSLYKKFNVISAIFCRKLKTNI